MDDLEYYIYCCPLCDEIWSGDDPLLRESPMDCPSCGYLEVESGLVENDPSNNPFPHNTSSRKSER